MTVSRLGWRFGFLAAALVAVGGCANGTTSVSGRVLAGRASVVTVVNADDPRLAEQGMADVRVRITRGDGTLSSLAETTSLPDGSFVLRVPERSMYGRLEVQATGPTVLSCRGSLYLPTDDRRVLVIVEPSNSHAVGEQPR